MQYRTFTCPVRSLFTLCSLAALSLAVAPQANAAFVGSYLASNWMPVVNTNADGSVSAPDTNTLILTGGQNGSGFPGTTDFLINAAATGTVSFDFSYFSADPLVGFDNAGYILGSTYVQLSDDTMSGNSGTVTFAVTQGQTFGFRAGTLDNTGEPGVLTVTNFNAPDILASVPEPATYPVLLLLACGVAVARIHSRHTSRNLA